MSAPYFFDVETSPASSAVEKSAPASASTSTEHQSQLHLSDRWNIGENPNGGYLVATCLRAMAALSPHPDPLSVTAHYLRPGIGDARADITAHIAKPGRTVSNLRSSLVQGGKPRVDVSAVFGDQERGAVRDSGRHLDLPPPDVPAPEECVHRNRLEQGVVLPIMDRLEVRIIPEHAEGGAGRRAEVIGWIRHADGRPVDALSLPLFADAYPPSVFALYGRIGWVPTIELTVHVRRRPVPGWVLARFRCDDLTGGTFIESGELWDADGHLVARSRQLAMLLADGDTRA